MAVTGDKGRRLFSIPETGEIGEQNQPELVQIYDQTSDDIRTVRALLQSENVTPRQIANVLCESILPNIRKLAEVAVVRVGMVEAMALQNANDDFTLDEEEVEMFDRVIDGTIHLLGGLMKTPGVPSDMLASVQTLLADAQKCKAILDEYLGPPDDAAAQT